MFNFFTNNKPVQPDDVKTVREALLQFIKHQLKKAEGGEGGNIKSLQLYIACPPDEKHMYEAALYVNEPDRFKNEEIQKIADDFAINLPEQWSLQINFETELPNIAAKMEQLPVALFIATTKSAVAKNVTAYILVRVGEAEKEMYTLHSNTGKICIGRGKTVQTADGFFRRNDIAFPEDSAQESNRFVSRQHAHIEFDPESGCFLLFADEGGVPPRNKIKLLSANTDAPVKLYSTQVGHRLQEGDQILLGQSALIEFSYQPTAKEL